MEDIIKFTNVKKKYKLYKNDKQRLLGAFIKKYKPVEKIAVDDVSFTIKKGESVAIFGKNGARKIYYFKNDYRSMFSNFWRS